MEQEILKLHQHKIKMILKTIKAFCILWFTSWIITYIISNSMVTTIIIVVITLICIYNYYYFFWSKSYFLVTNESISINVRNGFFSQYDMRIHFSQIKDMAYSKNHFLHYFFNYWVMFVRSSAAADGSFIIDDIPNIEEVYKKISYMHSIGDDGRKKLINHDICEKKQTKSKEEIIENARNTLLNIKGIVEVNILSAQDKQFIFTHEEDRNHGVYESIKRQITLVATHDSSFREADAPIVLKLWNKVIFPPVSFHEIQEKNTVSSSPWIEIHNYLIKKIKNIWEFDATLLIWFDI